MKTRISIVKEDRIWSLREQGYCYESIASIVNIAPNSPHKVLRRVMRRPPIEVDPIRRGRGHSWMSDQQIEDIRNRRERGQTLLGIAKLYNVSTSAISNICNYRSYVEPEEDYPRVFHNRLMLSRKVCA